MAPTATGPTAAAAPTPAAAPSFATPLPSTSTSTTAATAPTSLEEANQRYTSTKLALRTGLANKRIIDRALVDLESQIYLYEGSYLQSTSTSGGNIVKGFDSYLKNSSSGTSGRNNNVNTDVALEDRIFSLSSATYAKSLELKANESLVEEEVREKESTPKPSKKKDVEDTPREGSGKKKKDKEELGTGKKSKKEGEKRKDKERSSTPSVKGGGGKNVESGGVTPTKGTGGGKAVGGTGTKLKRKLTDATAAGSGGSATSTPGGKAQKRKKDDD